MGGFLHADTPGKFAFQGELLYSDKGYRFDDYGALERMRLHYVSLPLLLQYKVLKKFYVELGPEFGYLLDAKSSINAAAFDANDFWSNKFDIGGDVGLGLNLVNEFSVGVRYSYSFLNVLGEVEFADSNGAYLYTATPTSQNRVLQVSVAYTFGK